MSSVRLAFFLATPLLIGCGSTIIATPVASLSEAPSEVVAPSPTDIPTNQTPSSSSGNAPRYTVRKVAIRSTEPAIPRVLLSASHAALCKVNVGDAFPAISLLRLGGATTELATLRGKQATVVLFWHPDRWMARTALTDMQRDVASQFAAEQVAVVGITVRQAAGSVQAALTKAQATFPQLLDTDGKAFTEVGTAALPRLYVLDPAGKVVWFDIEYSEGTRRELWQTLRVLTLVADK